MEGCAMHVHTNLIENLSISVYNTDVRNLTRRWRDLRELPVATLTARILEYYRVVHEIKCQNEGFR
jgi:hypothetical protein